ncbi:MAG: hypothetical protein FWF29_12910 [Treponema sp.]|nr:hypothetical protein [Treponema sp.]
MGNYKNFFLVLFLLSGIAGFAPSQDLPGSSNEASSTPPGAVQAVSGDDSSDSGSNSNTNAAPATDTSKDTNGTGTTGKNAPIYSTPVEGEPSFKISDTEGSVLFSQRLTWEEAQYAARYVVILERKRDNLDTYTEVLRKNVDAGNSYLDISVPAGTYRFMVQSYNILDQLDTESPWQEFTILQALQPSVVSFDPAVFYMDRETPRILTLLGENLLPDAEIYLQKQSASGEPEEEGILRPKEIYRNELGENARLIFAEEDLVVGRYEIVVKNPGGLETRAGFFSVAIAKPFDINVAAGYAPMLTIFGQRDFFLDRFFVPLGFTARASYIPFKLDIGYIGVELCPSWALLTSQKDNDKTTAHLVVVNIDALYQYWLKRRMLAINARAGVGIAGIFDYHFEFLDTGRNSNSMSTTAFSFNFGSSVQWFFYKQFFAEGGVDYIHIAHPEIPMGFIRIGLLGGYQF